MYNKIIIIGNIGKDAEIKDFGDGNQQIKFTVATSTVYKDKNTGEFVNTTIWHNIQKNSKFAESESTKLKKGNMVVVEGIQNNSQYEKDGIKKTYSFIKAERIKLIHKMDNENNSNNISHYETPPELSPATSTDTNMEKTSDAEFRKDGKTEDVPF